MKPHIYKVWNVPSWMMPYWVCRGQGFCGFGQTKEEAYKFWEYDKNIPIGVMDGGV